MARTKHNPIPWDFLDAYRGRFFEGQWPSLAQMFNITIDRYGDRPCWECFTPEHIHFTFKEAKAQMDKVSSFLVSKGVRKGDRVAVTGKNSPEWAVAYMAIVQMGAIVCPIDYSLTDEEIEHFCDFTEVKGLFVDGERFERLGKDGKYGFKVSLEKKNHEDDYILNLAGKKGAKWETPVAKDLAAFLFTSGTTGTPKVVMLTHENLVSDCYLAQSQMNIYCTDVFYAILPIHHAYTMLAVFIEAMSVGANVIFGKKLIVKQLLKEMKDGKVTMFLGVPMLFNKLLSGIMKGVEEKGKLASALIGCMMGFSGFVKKTFGVNIGKKLFGKSILSKVSLDKNRICISGGGPLPSETFKKFNQLGIDFVQGYGLTETSPILTLNPIFDFNEKSIGKLISGVDMMFADSDAQGNGEICVKGSMVMQGYYKNPSATAEMIDKEGWLHTGDVGYMDERGFVILTGRAKNIIVTEGGKNVFPEEIEDRFQLYYDIEQICVLPYMVDKAKKSEGVCALIYPSEDYRKREQDPQARKAHMEQIVEEVNKELLPYQRIRHIALIDEPMEMSSTKKIKRFVVKKKYEDILNGFGQ